MRLNKLYQTATFRLAALYVLLFAASVAVLGVLAYGIISFAVERRLDARIASEMTTLLASYRSGGLSALQAKVEERQRSRPAGLLSYRIVGAHGERLGGGLESIPERTGWSDIAIRESDGDFGRLRALTSELDLGGRLTVAVDREDVDEIKETIVYSFMSAFGAVIVLGIAGGIAMSLAFLKRVETIGRTAEAIIGGDLARRVPVRGTNDDLDRLSQTFNRMLDRITELMESLRQVSADIAHDLKTPLTRLRQRLEAARPAANPSSAHGAVIEPAVESIDDILATFDALLRIAQIESRTRRAGFRELDLSEVFTTVANAFAPPAEDAGKCLEAKIEPEIRILGDRELLTQMLANLIENAIRHTPAGICIEVSLRRIGDQIVAAVADNGPGVPERERNRIFRRLYRLERSRSTPGSGLGLSLAKAVGDLHDISFEVLDGRPGLVVAIKFPRATMNA